jgi:hypothetical protein
MNTSLYQSLLEELRLLLSPLHLSSGDGTSTPNGSGARPPSDHGWQPIFRAIGWNVDVIDGLSFDILSQQSLALNVSFDHLDQWVAAPPATWEALRDAFGVSTTILDAVRQLHTLLADPPPTWENLGKDIITYLILSYLESRWPSLYTIAIVTSLIELPRGPISAADWVADKNGRLVRRPYRAPTLHFDRIGQYLADPLGTLRHLYLSGETLDTAAAAHAAADRLFPFLGALFTALGAAATYGMKPDTYHLEYDAVTRELASHMLWVKFAPGLGQQRLGAILALSAADQGNLGLIVTPTGDVTFEQLLQRWQLSFAMTPGVQSFALGPQGPTLIADPPATAMHAQLSATYVPADEGSTLLIGSLAGSHLKIDQLSIGGEVSLDTVQNSQEYTLALGAGASALVLSGLLTLSWDSLRWSVGRSTTRLTLTNLRFQIDLLPDFALAGDLDLQFENGKAKAGSSIKLRKPHVVDLPITNFHIDNTHFSITISESNLNRWLGLISADLIDRGPPSPADLTLQLIFGQGRRELRLDWDIKEERTYALPGINVIVPPGARFTIALTSTVSNFDRLALVLTVPRGKALTAESTFAWGRSGERELHNDDGRAPDAAPLFALALEAKIIDPQASPNLSLLLFELPLDGSGAPKFLRQLPPLAPIQDQPYTPLDLGAAFKLRADDWIGHLTLNLNDFKLPFLRNDASDKEQAIQLSLPPPTPPAPGQPVLPPGTFELNFGAATVTIPINATVKLGSLSFATQLGFVFNWETFGLDVNHDAGIQLVSDADTLVGGRFLNLDWAFKGHRLTEGLNKDKYHYLTLITKDYNYEIQQAPGAEFTVSYTGISDEPLVFSIAGLVIRPAGLSLEARVRELPIRLKGIDAKFSFSNSGFVMKDSRITEFTLAGSGALPPDLVGESRVDIFLRFGEKDGGLTLIEGKAALRGNKLLKCKSTRFEFSIEQIGISFVHEGQFHLYFTLTGRAQFRLSDGDDREGLLALLPNITIEMVDCPLAGDVRVLAKHIRFLITLPRPKSFNLLGCFELELRGFGFLPQAEMFGGDAAMWLSGQVKFAEGAGDSKNDKVDFHSLYIGLPEPGDIFPRLHFEQIVVDVKIADAFQLYAMVKYEDTPTARGFSGEGVIRVAGLPKLEAAFAFLRVRSNDTNAWVRAWFIYAQVSELSLMIPIVQIYIREIGFGLGYRYTLAMIKAADEERDVKKLLKGLDNLAKSQGELAKLDSWRVDIDGPGDPRFTLVLRAMISQTSASSPTALNRIGEKDLACTFLFDAVLAFRSDLTFLITARGWIYTNYVDYVDNVDGLRRRPFFFAYILLSAPQKRFLARMGNTPGGYIGNHPPLPEFVKTALQGVRFRATLLIEPGLFHLDLGWPNQLGWSATLGPFKVSIVGGFILRISRQDLVIGVSYMARGSMEISGGVDAGIAGVRVYARADVAYGMRYIGVLSFDDPTGKSLFYGAMGIELMIQFSVEFYLNLLFKKIRLHFSFTIVFTAALEFGLDGLSPGVRGQGTLALKVCGRSFRVSIKIAVNEDAVSAALKRTEEYMKLGLDADDTGGPPEPVPGTAPATLGVGEQVAGRAALLAARRTRRAVARPMVLDVEAVPALASPHYSALVVRPAGSTPGDWSYFVIFPRAALLPDDESAGLPQRGFLPLPPTNGSSEPDFVLSVLALNAGFELQHARIDGDQVSWDEPADGAFTWRANWHAQSPLDVGSDPTFIAQNTIGNYMLSAFVDKQGHLHDPDDLGELDQETLADDRVYNPSEGDFEAAVRGAFEQFQGAPFFKRDPDLAYDQALDQAFHPDTTIYASTQPQASGTDKGEDRAGDADAQQHADQIRGMIAHMIVSDLRTFVDGSTEKQRAAIAQRSLAFQMGLVFRFKGDAPWLTSGEASPVERPLIEQRAPAGGLGPQRKLWVFNPPHTSFERYSPTFSRVRHYANASTIAIAWQLTWEVPPPDCVAEQADPEHHLAYYRVLRRALDSNERDVIFTVKSAEVLHRANDSADTSAASPDTLKILKPRFQIADHFTRETPAERAALPDTGRSYLYTITPIDNAGSPGRPLTLVATRYPDQPPRVPTDAKLRVRYLLEATMLDSAPPLVLSAPELIEPASITVEWSEPPLDHDENRVPIKLYRLIFRRAAATPVGSYGLDSTTQRSAATLIGSAVARPLPTDIKVDLPTPDRDGEARSTTIALAGLKQAGVFPAGVPSLWQPDAWDVFIQAIALNDVPSSLASAQIVIEAARDGAGAPLPTERQPAELEWLPKPLNLPLLPPEDQRAIVGDAFFPMPYLPKSDAQPAITFDGTLANIHYQRHPDGIRCVRIRWNQGPSAHPAYPLDLTAGFRLLELDIDAYTTATFADAERLADALRLLQEIRMVPAADLPFIPGGTLEPSQWESWYPSTMQRRVSLGEQDATSSQQAEQRSPGSQIPFRPWYSWRESLLEWPSPVVDDEPHWRETDLHPFLQRIVDRLDGVLFCTPADSAVFNELDSIAAIPTNDAPASQTRDQLYALLPFLNNLLPLSEQARLRVVSQGFEWRIDDPGNATVLYRFENSIVKAQTLRIVRNKTGVAVSVASPYVVDRQELLPAQAGDLSAFLEATPAKSDPYGWAVLQAFGLSATFALRDARSAQPILGQALLDALKLTIDDCLSLQMRKFAEFQKHLFVELLFQPSYSVEVGEPKLPAAPAGGLLAHVQLSLRPAIKQRRVYAKLSISAPANPRADDSSKITVNLIFKLVPGQALDIITMSERGGGQQSVNNVNGIGTINLTVPAGRTTDLIMRSGFEPGHEDDPVVPALGLVADAKLDLSGLTDYFEVSVVPEVNGTTYVFFKPGAAWPTLATEHAALFGRLKQALQAVGVTLPIIDLTVPQAFAPTDELSTDFTAPQDALAHMFAGDTSVGAGAQWLRFKTYADAVYTSAATRIVTPTDQPGITKLLPAFLSWSQRFFDAAGTVHFDSSKHPFGSYGEGYWPASAYPRAGTPAYVTPDASGRLTYNYLLQDKWAHTFRYYLQPYNRYARLHDALRDALQPPSAPRAPEPPAVMIDPAAGSLNTVGGLDVVIERTQPLAAPLVLFSGRLDETGAPNQPAQPGSTWEVIIAQHPEQALSERNQSVRRRLAFRQLAFTLLRRFAATDWLAWLQDHQPEGVTLDYRSIKDVTQPIPHVYPPAPDHIDLPALRGDTAALSAIERAERAAERRSLDLPLRLHRFQQGALVLQWEGLPFYYEHRLLLIAQADSQVSPVRELTQRDFEYRSPLPSATAAGARVPWPDNAPFQPPAPAEAGLRGRQLSIPLRRFWDSLPASAMARWASENPGDAPYGGARSFASLPDQEVVYQIVELFGGNSEVQAELFFMPPPQTPPAAGDGAPGYIRRQLGKRVIASEPAFIAPPDGQGDYMLNVRLAQFVELQLAKTYDQLALPTALLTETRLLVAGSLDPQSYTMLRQVITEAADRAVVDDFYKSWESREPVSARLASDDPLGAGLALIESLSELALVWSGPLTASARDAILALDGDDDFKAALARLVSKAATAQEQITLSEIVSLLPNQHRAAAPAQLTLVVEASGAVSGMTWNGLMLQEQRDALYAWLQKLTDEPDLIAAVHRLIPAVLATQESLVTRETAPRGLDQPPLIGDDLRPLFERLVLDHATKQLIWNGTLYDDEKALIEPVLREWAQIRTFREALDRLFAVIEGRTITMVGRVRPLQSMLPPELQHSLRLADETITWLGEPPTPEQRTAIASILAESIFVSTLQRLLAQLQNPNGLAAPLALPDDTAPPALPDALAGRLSITGAAGQRTLHWSGTVPDAAQQSALDALRTDPLLGTAITTLIAQIDGLRQITLPPAPPPLESVNRPEFATLREQLHVATDAGATTFTWAGRLRNSDQTAALATLQTFLTGSNAYRTLASALKQLTTQLALPFTADFDLVPRPEQSKLPASLGSRLLLGHYEIAFQGVMTRDEGLALSRLYAAPPAEPPDMPTADIRAIQRLYEATLQKGLRGRELKIRARRANAAPSALRALAIELLIPPAPKQEPPV